MTHRSIVLFFAALLLCSPPAAQGTDQKAPAKNIARKGTLPVNGRIVIRSGLAWMDETTPLFMHLREALVTLLIQRGLVVVSINPSALLPMPKTTLPPNADEMTKPVLTPRALGANGAESSQLKAVGLARAGKLPKLKLRGYDTPDRDADLPASVRAVRPPDIDRALFALSQQKGTPVLRNGERIPGHMPEELQTVDSQNADYAIVARFTTIQPPLANNWMRRLAPPMQFTPARHILMAAGYGGVGGSGALGFGSPAPSSSSGRNTYGTPGGYVRGYEGSAPSDMWHRDSDFYMRDYQLKNNPPASFATPPLGFSSSPCGKGGLGDVSTGAYEARGGLSARYLLELDCYDIIPARIGKSPRIIWQATAEQLADKNGLRLALPSMVRAIFAENTL